MALGIITKRRSKLATAYGSADSVKQRIWNAKVGAKSARSFGMIRLSHEQKLERLITDFVELNSKISDQRSKTKFAIFGDSYKTYQKNKRDAEICIEMFLEEANAAVSDDKGDDVGMTSIWDYLLKQNHADVYWQDVGGSKEKLLVNYEKYSPQIKALFEDLHINGVKYELLKVFALISNGFKGIVNIPKMPDISLSLEISFPTLNLPSITIPSFTIPQDILNALKVQFPDLSLDQLKNIFSYVFILKYITVRLPEINLPSVSLPTPDIARVIINGIKYDLSKIKNIISIPTMPYISLGLNLTLPNINFPIFIPSITIPQSFIEALQKLNDYKQYTKEQLLNLVRNYYLLKQLEVLIPGLPIPAFPNLPNFPALPPIPKVYLELPKLELNLPDLPKIPNFPKINLDDIKNGIMDFVSDLLVSVPLFPLGIVKNVRKLYVYGKTSYKNYKLKKQAHISSFTKKNTSKLHIVLSDSIEGEYTARCARSAVKCAQSAIQIASIAIPFGSAITSGIKIGDYSYMMYRFCADWNDFRKLRNMLHNYSATANPTYPSLNKFVTYPALSCCVLVELAQDQFIRAVCTDVNGNNVIIKELDSIVAKTLREVKASPEVKKNLEDKLFETWFKFLKGAAAEMQGDFPYIVSTKGKYDNVYEIVKATVEDEMTGILRDRGIESVVEKIKEFDENIGDMIEECVGAAIEVSDTDEMASGDLEEADMKSDISNLISQ